jgi:hypothetical protein
MTPATFIKGVIKFSGGDLQMIEEAQTRQEKMQINSSVDQDSYRGREI